MRTRQYKWYTTCAENMARVGSCKDRFLLQAHKYIFNLYSNGIWERHGTSHTLLLVYFFLSKTWTWNFWLKGFQESSSKTNSNIYSFSKYFHGRMQASGSCRLIMDDQWSWSTFSTLWDSIFSIMWVQPLGPSHPGMQLLLLYLGFPIQWPQFSL